MKKVILGLLLVVLSPFISSSIFAEKWTVAVDQDFPPYTYKENGEIKGIHTDIAKAVLDIMQVKYTMKAYPWKRVVRNTDKAEVTFSLTWVEKPQRFKKYLMMGPLQKGRTVFMVRKDSQIKFEKLTDLKGYTIGTISGYAYPKVFEEATFLNKKPATMDNARAIQKMLKKRIDLIIGDENVLGSEAKKLGVSDQIKVLPRPLKVVYRYAVFPKAHAVQAAQFANALNELKYNRKAYQAIIDKYRR